VPRHRVGRLAEDIALGRLDGEREKVRRHDDFHHAAKSWTFERRVIAPPRGSRAADSRFILTNLPSLPGALSRKVYRARG
jgi:hypothetical protein